MQKKEKVLEDYLDNPNNQAPINKQILLVGDSKVGKSALITKFYKNKFRLRYRPTYDLEYVNKKGYVVKNRLMDL